MKVLTFKDHAHGALNNLGGAFEGASSIPGAIQAGSLANAPMRSAGRYLFAPPLRKRYPIAHAQAQQGDIQRASSQF